MKKQNRSQSSENHSAERIGAYYDNWTAKYQKHFGDTIQAYRPAELEGLHQYVMEKSGMKDGQTILDAGCGVCGPCSYFANRLDSKFEAITISDVQVEIAKSILQEKGGTDRVTVQKGDFHRLDSIFPEEHFDLVFFLEAFSHVIDLDAVVAGVYQVLKPGGTVYIKDYFKLCVDNPEEQSRIDRVIENIDRHFQTTTIPAREVFDSFVRHGFRAQYFELVSFDVDDSVWNGFDQEHDFDLFDGGELYGEWCDRYDMLFQKPKAPKQRWWKGFLGGGRGRSPAIHD